MGDGASASDTVNSTHSRVLPALTTVGHHRSLFGGEPVVFHCNHYNYWLQHTPRIDPGLQMDSVIRAAAESCARAVLIRGVSELGLGDESAILQLASDCFAQLGFGRLDFSQVGPEGGVVRTPVSHYGQMLGGACVGRIEKEQNMFDQGFAAAAVGVAYGVEPGGFTVRDNRCMALGAEIGEFELVRGEPEEVYSVPGVGILGDETPAGPAEDTNIDERAIRGALAGLDFSGNEEGLIPRFGVVLTRHFANFYNRVSFELIRRVDPGMLDVVEELLVEAGRRCAFNTFGGIMCSAEWDAVVRPQCQTTEDWFHGMIAVVNSLGWGCWRVVEVNRQRAVVRVWDDYESTGWLGMYGRAERPISYLALGAVEGLMALIYKADIAKRPVLDESLFLTTCTSASRYRAHQTRSLAQGDPHSEFVVEVV